MEETGQRAVTVVLKPLLKNVDHQVRLGLGSHDTLERHHQNRREQRRCVVPDGRERVVGIRSVYQDHCFDGGHPVGRIDVAAGLSIVRNHDGRLVVHLELVVTGAVRNEPAPQERERVATSDCRFRAQVVAPCANRQLVDGRQNLRQVGAQHDAPLPHQVGKGLLDRLNREQPRLDQRVQQKRVVRGKVHRELERGDRLQRPRVMHYQQPLRSATMSDVEQQCHELLPGSEVAGEVPAARMPDRRQWHRRHEPACPGVVVLLPRLGAVCVRVEDGVSDRDCQDAQIPLQGERKASVDPLIRREQLRREPRLAALADDHSQKLLEVLARKVLEETLGRFVGRKRRLAGRRPRMANPLPDHGSSGRVHALQSHDQKLPTKQLQGLRSREQPGQRGVLLAAQDLEHPDRATHTAKNLRFELLVVVREHAGHVFR